MERHPLASAPAFPVLVAGTKPITLSSRVKKNHIMNAETILRSDVLDIIFENRNKQYGAYDLRKGYRRRLFHALSMMLGGVVLLFGMNFLKGQQRSGSSTIHGTTDSVVTISLIAPPVEEPKPAILPIQAVPKLATVDYQPIKIVPDPMVTEPLATIDDLYKGVISNTTKDSDTPALDNQVAGPVETNMTVTTAIPTTEAIEPDVYEAPEVRPEFPGGTGALSRFLSKHLQVPEGAVEPGQLLRVPVKFVIEKEGTISQITFQQEVSPEVKNEILRVFKKMPKWEAASQKGKRVNAYLTIPIVFQVTE
jgi:periplasmic protein TonB